MVNNLTAAVKAAIPTINASANGIVVNDIDLTCFQNGKDAIKNLFSHYDLTLDEDIMFAPKEALLNCSEDADAARVFSNNVEHTIKVEVLPFLEDVKTRYSLAFKSQTPIERTTAERRALMFNKVAFALAQRNGHFVFLPGTPSAVQFEPVDPRTLDCPEPAESKVVHVESAMVTGARDADGGQMQLPYNGKVEIKVLISLQHGRVAEVLHPTTLDEGQSCWKKVTRMTADVLVERGKISRVIGTPTFVREEEK